MALPLPRAAVLLLLLAAPLLCAAQGPISQPPSPGAPAASPLLHPDSTAADEGAEGAKSASPSTAPAAHSPALSPAGDDDKAASPPAPTETAPAEAPAPASSSSSPHSTAAATPAPAPAPYDSDDYDDAPKAPAPAPATMQVKSATGTGASDVDQHPQPVDAAENVRREGMSGGKKAGVVVGVFSAVAVVGLFVVVYRKRQANIRRSRYADYSARLELV